MVTTRNQQVARIDYEGDSEIAASVEATVVRRIGELAASAHAIVISDYLKGVVTPQVAAAAAHAARTHRIPLLVDPKVPHIDRYAGATLDHAEPPRSGVRDAHADSFGSRRAGGRAPVPGPCGERRRAHHERRARDVAARARGPDSKDGQDVEIDLPAEAREVADVTGAGDTVISALALAAAAGASLTEAARLANRAAGIVVGKFGPATVTVEELRDGSQALGSRL